MAARILIQLQIKKFMPLRDGSIMAIECRRHNA